MRYPMCCDWLVFKENDVGSFVVEDYLNQRRVTLSSEEAIFLRKLDGFKNPYCIDKRLNHDIIDKMMLRFVRHDLIRTSRFVSKSIFSVMFTVCFLKHNKGTIKKAKKINIALLLCFLPVFITGVFIYVKYGDAGYEYISSGFCVGLIIGMILHETGHAIAGMSYGARMFEAGVFWRLFLPGAYVLMDGRPVKNTLHRVQIY